MLQTRLDRYLKKTKSSSEDNKNFKDDTVFKEITPKTKRRLTPAAMALKMARAKANQNPPVKTNISSSPVHKAKKQRNNDPTTVIPLDESDHETSALKPSAASTKLPQKPKPRRCLSFNPERHRNRGDNVPSFSKVSTSKTAQTSEAQPTYPQTMKTSLKVELQTPKKSGTSGTSTSSQLLNVPKAQAQISPSSQTSISLTKGLKLSQASKTSRFSTVLSESPSTSSETSPKRRLNFTISQSLEKRQKTDKITSQVLTREDTFQGQILNSTTSFFKAGKVSEILENELNREISFGRKFDTIIKEELMKSEDEWCFEDINESALQTSEQTSNRSSCHTSFEIPRQISGETKSKMAQQTSRRTQLETSGKSSHEVSLQTSCQVQCRISVQKSHQNFHRSPNKTSLQTPVHTSLQTSQQTSSQTLHPTSPEISLRSSHQSSHQASLQTLTENFSKTSAQTSSGTSPMKHLTILPPEVINRKFVSFQESAKPCHFPDKENIEENLLNFKSKIAEEPSRTSLQTSEVNFSRNGYQKTPRTPEKRQISQLESAPSASSDTSPSKFSPSKLSPLSRRLCRARKMFGGIDFQSAVENLNLAKQGAIRMNDFDIGNIYASCEFHWQWGVMNNSTAERFDVRDTVMPNNKHSERLFEMISWVFSEPLYCGYFNDEERNIVFRMMCLKKKHQVLLSMMIRRKIKWFRVRKQNCDAVCDGNMEAYFMELAEDGFFDSDWTNVDVDVIFKLLHADELRDLCRLMKMNHQVAKPRMISSLKTLLRQKTSAFNTSSPSEVLKLRLTAVAGPILKVSDKVASMVNRILTLYYPTQSPEEKLSDAFFLFSDVHDGNRFFPPYEIRQFPLFRDRQALIDYVEAKQTWSEVLQINQQKNKGLAHWEVIRNCGTRAYKQLHEFLATTWSPEFEGPAAECLKTVSNRSNLTAEGSKVSPQISHTSTNIFQTSPNSSKVPFFINRFSAPYVWAKVLMLSIEAFKKLKTDGYAQCQTYLEFLLKNRARVPVNPGKIYKELTMIEMAHLGNLERSAQLTLEAFQTAPSPIDQAEMMERARKLVKRTRGLSQDTRNKLQVVLMENEELFACFPQENAIEVTKLDKDGGGKSLWQLDLDADKGYGTVEDVALSHYAQAGYPRGIHCEGSLPVTLFACLFWQEIYELEVPAAFVAKFQREPLDLFSTMFYERRREALDRKMSEVLAMDDLEPLWNSMAECFEKFQRAECIISQVVPDVECFRGILRCLGKNGIVGICRKVLYGGLSNWRAGFPDLFVWNERKNRCKVVEVKGPGDTLSIKQQLWIKHLADVGVKVEVCLVRAKQRC